MKVNVSNSRLYVVGCACLSNVAHGVPRRFRKAVDSQNKKLVSPDLTGHTLDCLPVGNWYGYSNCRCDFNLRADTPDRASSCFTKKPHRIRKVFAQDTKAVSQGRADANVNLRDDIPDKASLSIQEGPSIAGAIHKHSKYTVLAFLPSCNWFNYIDASKRGTEAIINNANSSKPHDEEHRFIHRSSSKRSGGVPIIFHKQQTQPRFITTRDLGQVSREMESNTIRSQL